MTTSTVTNIENMPLDKRMALQGYSVTDKRWGGWDNANRMVIDKDGKEVVYIGTGDIFRKIAHSTEDNEDTKRVQAILNSGPKT